MDSRMGDALLKERQIRNMSENAAFHPIFVVKTQALKIVWIE